VILHLEKTPEKEVETPRKKGEKNSLSEGLEVVKSTTDLFQDLDPVVGALTDAVGFVIFPGVAMFCNSA